MELPSGNNKVIWDTRRVNPRTCIMFRNDICLVCISELVSRDLVPIRTFINNSGADQEVMVALGYFPGDGEALPVSS